MAGRLEGKTALITGGASGMGAAIAELYAKEGATIAIADRQADLAMEIADRCETHGVRATAHIVDVSDAVAMESMVADVAQAHGGIDILVAAAGVVQEMPFLELSPEAFDRMIAIDLRGVFLAARFVAPIMVERGGGRIITISSQLAIKGGIKVAHYVSAKAGVIGLTKAMALELAPHGILVNSIAPGPIRTPLFDTFSQEWQDQKQAELPINRFGTPAEIAPTALLLAASPDGDIYVGQTLGPNSGDVMP